MGKTGELWLTCDEISGKSSWLNCPIISLYRMDRCMYNTPQIYHECDDLLDFGDPNYYTRLANIFEEK